MLTYTVCSEFTITSALIVEGADLSVVATYNGETIYQVENFVPDFLETSITFTAENLNGEEEFVDGIYNVCVVSTESNGTTNQECFCVFVDCVTRCLVAEAILCDNLDAFKYYKGLEYAEGCADCECDVLVELFKYLQIELDKECVKDKKNDNICC